MLTITLGTCHGKLDTLTYEQIKKSDGIYEVAPSVSMDKDVLLIVSSNKVYLLQRNQIVLPLAGWEDYTYVKSNQTITLSN